MTRPSAAAQRERSPIGASRDPARGACWSVLRRPMRDLPVILQNLEVSRAQIAQGRLARRGYGKFAVQELINGRFLIEQGGPSGVPPRLACGLPKIWASPGARFRGSAQRARVFVHSASPAITVPKPL